MVARYYSWKDTGGPGPQSTTSGNYLLTRLRTILRACLVDGYAGRAPAGWSLVSEFDEAITLRPASNCAQVTLHLHAGYPNGVYDLYLHEGILDASTPLPRGINTRSYQYSADSNASANRRHTLYHGNSSGAWYWTLIADEETFVLNVNLATAFTASGSAYSQLLYVGQYRNWNGLSGVQGFIAVGGGNSMVNSSSGSHDGWLFQGGYTSLRDQKTGVALTGIGNELSANPFRFHSSSSWIARGEGDNPPRFTLLQPQVTDGSNYVGELRGLLVDPTLSRFAPGHMASRLGITESYNSMGEPLDFEGVPMSFQVCSTGTLFFSTDPQFWT